ncbi:DNA-binding protein [Streptomyces sp. SP18ES09]|uniref:DNA-binding protein n=1 Tax=Streptomyces sp. SP18ES09 TaxID=3002532 RepID=UPI002E77556F|nr:DNA-binding protein [Streptomyces sp. SP18ES09]MEE1813540.1 DNA-binding protein [Streptomyces sp. SP18ES09]
MPGDPALVDDAAIAYYTARPASTIRRWAAVGLVSRYGSGRGKVRYDAREFIPAVRDGRGRVLEEGGIPELMERRKAA